MVHPQTPIKVLFVITSSGIGGAEKVLYHTSTLLDPERYTASICSLKEKGQIARQAETAGIAVHSLTMADGDRAFGWISSLGALFRLTRYLFKLRPTIVHSFLFRANIISRIAAFLARVPIVISSVRVMGGEKDYYHTIEKVTSFMVDHYVTVSESVMEHLIHKANIRQEKITTIYNGVSLSRQNPRGKGSALGHLGLGPHDRVVLSVGRLHRQKGYDCLIRAIGTVKREVSTLKVLIVGEGEGENDLKNLVKSLDLSKEVFFTGLCLMWENSLTLHVFLYCPLSGKGCLMPFLKPWLPQNRWWPPGLAVSLNLLWMVKRAYSFLPKIQTPLPVLLQIFSRIPSKLTAWEVLEGYGCRSTLV